MFWKLYAKGSEKCEIEGQTFFLMQYEVYKEKVPNEEGFEYPQIDEKNASDVTSVSRFAQ